MQGWQLEGKMADKGAAVLPDVVGMLDERVTGSAAAAAAGAATHAMVAASWAAMGLAVVGSEEGPQDAGAGMAGSVGAQGSRAGSVGAAVDGSVVTWVQQNGWEQGEVQLLLQQQQMQQPALWLGWVLLLVSVSPWS